MDRDAFEHLYLHAHTLAEFGFMRAMERLATTDTAALAPEQLAANEADAQQMLNLDAASFDWSALEGVDAFGAEPDALDAAATARYDGPTFTEALAIDDEVGGDALPELANYLERAHAARALLAGRIAHSWAMVDQQALDDALAALPEGSAPLTGPLSADELAPWLALYEQRHPALDALVQQIRKLEPF
jgi:hypothetical protein